MTIEAKLKAHNMPQAQIDTTLRMLAAPAGGWRATKILGATYLGVVCDGRLVQLESRKLGIFGVVMPDGSFIKPKAGRKTISAADIAYKL